MDLFKDCLTERFQSVKIGCKVSGVLQTKLGVPQGNIRGPILFCVFVAGLPSATQCYKGCSPDDSEKLVLELGKSEFGSRNNGFDLSLKDDWVQSKLSGKLIMRKIFVLVARLCKKFGRCV